MGKREDKITATNAVYATNGAGPCPFEEGSRLAKFWHKTQQHYLNMESRFDELAAVYGEFRPERLKADGSAGAEKRDTPAT